VVLSAEITRLRGTKASFSLSCDDTISSTPPHFCSKREERKRSEGGQEAGWGLNRPKRRKRQRKRRRRRRRSRRRRSRRKREGA